MKEDPTNRGGGLLPGSGKRAKALPIIASRLKFETRPSFRPLRYMEDAELRATLEKPKLARKPEHLWPPIPRCKHNGAADQILELYRKWDKCESLCLFEASVSERAYRATLFAVEKDLERDRQISNAVRKNSREFSSSRFVRFLGGAFQSVDIWVPPGCQLLGSSEDIEDYYHEWFVSVEMALRHHLEWVWPAETFEGWSAWDPKFAGKLVVVGFKSMAMGNLRAVEWRSVRT